ncbi:MAG: methyltransferase domain-containing protein [bacterium]|nr:methyltransferase domain-containing protein [bacterium]
MPKDWWKTFFEKDFAQLFLERDPHEVEEAADFLVKQLHVKKGDVVLDQCSGIGNISHALARRGYRAIGVEQAGPYVQQAQQAALHEGLDCRFYRGDALRFLPKKKVDAAFNWYTSFGYYLDDARNLAMLKKAFQSLKRGGWFALDFNNPLFIASNFESTRKYTKRIGGKTVRVIRKSWVDLEKGTLTSEWRYEFPGKPARTRSGTTRLYLPTELKRLFLEAGFRDLRFFGGADGSKLTLESPRCIVVARKPL